MKGLLLDFFNLHAGKSIRGRLTSSIAFLLAVAAEHNVEGGTRFNTFFSNSTKLKSLLGGVVL